MDISITPEVAAEIRRHATSLEISFFKYNGSGYLLYVSRNRENRSHKVADSIHLSDDRVDALRKVRQFLDTFLPNKSDRLMVELSSHGSADTAQF